MPSPKFNATSPEHRAWAHQLANVLNVDEETLCRVARCIPSLASLEPVDAAARIRTRVDDLAREAEAPAATVQEAFLRVPRLLSNTPSVTLSKLKLVQAIAEYLGEPTEATAILTNNPLLLAYSTERLRQRLKLAMLGDRRWSLSKTISMSERKAQRFLGPSDPSVPCRRGIPQPTRPSLARLELTRHGDPAQRVEALAEALDVTVSVVVRAARRDGRLLQRDPDALVANMHATARGLGIPLPIYRKIALKGAKILLIGPETLIRNGQWLQTRFELSADGLAKMLLRSPLLLYADAAPLASKSKRSMIGF